MTLRFDRRARNLTAVVLLVLLTIPAVAFAAGARGHRNGQRLGAGLQRVIDRLDLTPAQTQEIKHILASHKDEVATEAAAVKEARLTLFAAIHGEVFDETAIRDASARVGAAETELAVTRGEIFDEIRAVLTPEQQEELQQILSDLRDLIDSLIDTVQARLSLVTG